MKLRYTILIASILVTGCASTNIHNLDAAVPDLEATRVQPGLDMLTRLNLPEYAETVEEAASYVLKPTEYEIVGKCATCPPESISILEDPISPLVLEDEATTVRRALLLIGGYKTGLVIDDINKKVAYKYVEED